MSRTLKLGFQPITPLRTPPRGEAYVRHGYRLRLPGGPVLNEDDPLLAACGATLTTILEDVDEATTVADDRFAPGTRLALEPEDDLDEGPGVGLWDPGRSVRLASIPGATGRRATAALELGIELLAVIVSELRSKRHGTRVGVQILVAPSALVHLGRIPAHPAPPAPHARRLVLIVDEDLRWWDPDASAGPSEIGDVPVAHDLATDLSEIRQRWQEVRERPVPTDPMETWEIDFARDEVLSEARRLWVRARREMAGECRVGWLEPGMKAPRWTPREDDDEGDWE
jgi:hypothetical protein